MPQLEPKDSVGWELGQRVALAHISEVENEDAQATNPEYVLAASHDEQEASINERVKQEVLEAVRWLITEIGSYRKPAVALDALAFASGLMILHPGISETTLGAKHGISRQAFSKLVVKISKKLNLPPSRAMKSVKARESYKKVNREYFMGRPVKIQK